jgi:tetratricopeptide (TPR) repeat protein
MAGHEDPEIPASQQVTAGEDANAAKGDLYVHLAASGEFSSRDSPSQNLDRMVGVQLGSGNVQVNYFQGDPTRIPPRGASNLPARNRFFTGRIKELARIDDLLSQESAIVSVQGLGGVGKTELVLEYAWINRDRYAITWWIRASSQVELTADLIMLSRALGLDADAEPQRAIDSMRDELAARSDWLLIFDDARDAAAIKRFLPSGSGRVLVSSRARNWTGVARLCPVEEMTHQEAIDYFCVSTGVDSIEAAELAEEFGRLPLALAQAAGYIAVRGCSAARYLELYRSAAHRILAEGPPPHGYPETVATTWLLHFESLSDSAIDLLRLVSFLAPESIPLSLMLDSAQEENTPETLRDVAGDPITREAAIGELVNAFLIIRLDDYTFRIHRLVQEITRSRLGKRERAIWVHRVANFVLAMFPPEPTLESNWSKMSLLTPHAQAVAMQVGPHQEAARAAVSLLQGIGLYLSEQEQLETAKSALEQALKLSMHTDKTRYSEAQMHLALAKISSGIPDFKAAIEHSKQALHIMEKNFGPTSPELIGPLLSLAYNYQGDRNDQQAYWHFDRIAEILSHGADLPAALALAALIGLGNGMMSAGELDVAQGNFERALILANSLYGEHSHAVAKVHVFLAWVHHYRGDQGPADAHLSTGIDAISDLFGAEHPYTRRLASRRTEWRTSSQC